MWHKENTELRSLLLSSGVDTVAGVCGSWVELKGTGFSNHTGLPQHLPSDNENTGLSTQHLLNNSLSKLVYCYKVP